MVADRVTSHILVQVAICIYHFLCIHNFFYSTHHKIAKYITTERELFFLLCKQIPHISSNLLTLKHLDCWRKMVCRLHYMTCIRNWNIFWTYCHVLSVSLITLTTVATKIMSLIPFFNSRGSREIAVCSMTLILMEI